MEKISYEKPRMERWQVKARCGMLAGSGYSPSSSSFGSTLSMDVTNLRLQEGGDNFKILLLKMKDSTLATGRK